MKLQDTRMELKDAHVQVAQVCIVFDTGLLMTEGKVVEIISGRACQLVHTTRHQLGHLSSCRGCSHVVNILSPLNTPCVGGQQ